MSNSKNVCYFNEMDDALIWKLIEHIHSKKDMLRFITTTKEGEIGFIIRTFQQRCYDKLKAIFGIFMEECIGLQDKFMQEEVMNTHFNLFFDGYRSVQHTSLLEDQNNLHEYNETFEAMMYDIATTMEGYDMLAELPRMYVEIQNSLRFKDDMKEVAKEALFKFDVDTVYENKLTLKFESGFAITINIYSTTEDGDDEPHIRVDASCVDFKGNKLIDNNYDINVKVDETDEWVRNDPKEWISSFMNSLNDVLNKKSLLGDIVDVSYDSDGEQFWRKAYFLLDVLPRLRI